MAKSPHITPEGHAALQAELQHIWRTQRPAVVRALADAAAEGDRSENAEYIYRKKELREIDRRLRYLTKRMDELKVVAGTPDDTSRVFFGALVTVADETGNEHEYRIVGSDEVDSAKRWISLDSPMARGLRGKGVDDVAVVQLPDGPAEFEVVAVRYA